MANMVTRTIISTKVKCLILDLTKDGVEPHEYTMCGTFKKPEAVLKAVQKTLPENCKAVHLVRSEEVETLYGMTEDVFLANAVELDPVTRKPITVQKEG